MSPAPRRNHSALLMGATMLIYGGQDETGNVLGDIHELDLIKMKWNVVPLDQHGS